jgi:predicted alpha/beta hydrolase family esterase
MEKGSVVVLHGSFGSPFENWFGWLYSQLAANDIRCFVVHLPTPMGQTFENWSRILSAYRASDCIDSGSTLVAHSSASPFAVRYISEESVSLARLITVAGFDAFASGDSAFDSINREVFTRGDGDFEDVRNLVSSRLALYSRNDPYLPLDSLKAFAEKLDAEKVEFESAGHFNDASGYQEFPELLDRLIH